LISLLLALYDVQRGQILLDGKDIRLIECGFAASIRSVLQEPFLFTARSKQ